MKTYRLKKRIDLKKLTDFAESAKASHTDIDGSYTGTPAGGGSPVQDADDL